MDTKNKNGHKLNRREFLRLAALGASGAVLAACVAPAPQAAEQPAAGAGEAEKTSAEPAAPEPVTIQWMSWGGADRMQSTVIDPFYEQNPDLTAWLTVEPVSPGKHDAEVYQAIRLALAAGGQDLPDVVQMNYIGVPEFAAAGLLYNLDDLMASFEDDLLEGTKVLASYDDTYVGVPREVKTKIWYYRQDMFDEAGIDVAEIKTYEDYMEAGRKLHETFPDSYIMNIGPQPIHYWYFMILSHWDDDEIRIANPDGAYNLAGNERYVTLLTWLKDWYDNIAFKTDDWSPDWQPAFADNVIAGDLVSQWMDFFLPSFAPEQGGLWGKALWPEFNRSGSEAGGSVWTIPAGASQPEEAFLFASRLLLDKDAVVRNWLITGYPPNTKSGRDEVLKMVETFERPEGMSDEEWQTLPINYFGKDYMNPHYEAHEYLEVFPYDPMASAELDILRKHTEAYMAGEKSLEEALSGAQSDMEAQLGNPYEGM